MSVVGFDIGNENCAIAVAKHGGIDVLLNDESKRETPAVVSFGEKQRFLGSAGAAFAATNPKSTISQIKRLIGRQYKEPSVQEDLKLLPLETSEGPCGGVLIHLEYLGKTWTFMPVEILGMLFAHLKQLTEKNLESPVVDCVIGIPSYFTDLQRREYLFAAYIAGLRPLQLMHDCTATALGYGMYKTDFFGDRPTNVVLVDIGHSDTQVTFAAFEEGKMATLSHSFDQHLGGRDFDEVLFRHFAAQFKEKYGIDVYSNTRASIRLMASCEMLKKVLSANMEAPLSIDCLIDDKDVNGFITREEFENLSQELLERVIHACCKAGNESGITTDEVHTIELVGSGSRIPAIMRKLTSLFGKEPMRTLNGSECVARGCALRCAMLSPTFRVRDYKVQDLFPYSIGLCSDDAENERHPEIMLFPKGSPFPSNDMIHFEGNTALSCQVFYTNKTDFPAGISPNVGHFMVSPSQNAGAETVKGLVKVQLNIHGIFEIKPEKVSIVNEAARKGWAKRQNLTVSRNLDVAMTKDELQEAQEREQILTEQDIKVEKTKEKRNTLESFIYDTRSKLLSSYRSLTTDSEQEIILKNLQETEEWLYEEGDDETEQVYITKLEDLKKLSDPIEVRYKDENARKEATKALKTCIQENRLAADLLPLRQKEEVINECIQVEQWLIHLTQLHDSLPKNATPIYCLNAISGITQAFKRRCKVIMRSNPSLPKYDEPVDSDQKHDPDGMLLEESKT
ncbi:hypothetical protein L2E82_40255 [Cichorium intybus]|uniref:Uncharacterized protein n=1 Tax=Cichorium intybus TaxID=13427 RepID=A0ACB9AKV8_CICIN|nr:hypothetical protein L2E82_40255 [Cichorium intybus]